MEGGEGGEGAAGRVRPGWVGLGGARAASPPFVRFEPFLKSGEVIWWPLPLILLSEHLLSTY